MRRDNGRNPDDGGSRPVVLPYASRDVVETRDPEDRDFAAASFVCGMFVFVPVLTGVMSMAFGIAVLRRARRVPRGELGTAILGTTMGAANVALWTAFFVMQW